MVSLADAPKLSAAPNFTVDTLLALRTELLPDGALFCLMGADAFFGLRSWRRSAEIPFVAPLIVASRPGQKLAGLKAALPPGLTMESASLTDQNGPKVPGSAGEVRSFLLHNPGGDTAPFYLLPGLHIEISASQVRDEIRDEIQDQDRDQVRARSGSPIASHKFLPNAVFDYIRARGLYR